MKISITREEFDKFMDYERLRRNFPCKNCKVNEAYCTGCDEEKRWNKKMSDAGVNKEEYTGVIAECMKAFWDAYDMNYQAEIMKKAAADCTKEFQRIRAMVDVDCDGGDGFDT